MSFGARRPRLFIQADSIEWIAKRLDLEPINIAEIGASFLLLCYARRHCKYQVRVCRTLSCALSGAYKTCKQFAFDCKVGTSSEDGLVTLEFVECHADCGRAPVVMVGEKQYTGVDSEKAASLIEQIKNGTVETE